MKKLLTLCLSALMIIGLLPFAAYAAGTASLTVQVDKTQIAPGEEIRLTVQGKGLKDLYGYELKLIFDDTMLTYKKATANWSGFSLPLNSDGLLTFAHTKLGKSAGTSGDTDIVTLVFEGLQQGTTFIALDSAKLVDSNNASVSLKPDESVALEIAGEMLQFNDLEKHWAKANIERAAALGIVNGYPDGSFHPNNKVTRAQFTAMLARAVLLDDTLEHSPLSFSDADQIPAWAEATIALAYEADIVRGYDDGSFRPDRLVTRTEMTAMIVRAIKLSTDDALIASFADAEQIPAWARSIVAVAAEVGLVRGKGNNRFDPLGDATRAEAVTIILSMLDYEAEQLDREVKGE